MVLDWVSKKFNTVTRSSFCAELRNQLEAAQSSIHLAAALEENCGPIKVSERLTDATRHRQVTHTHHTVWRQHRGLHKTKAYWKIVNGLLIWPKKAATKKPS